MKLWEAIKALDDGQDVQYKHRLEPIKWSVFTAQDTFSPLHENVFEFRIKPKSHGPLECWIVISDASTRSYYRTKEDAEEACKGLSNENTIAAHMREVTE